MRRSVHELASAYALDTLAPRELRRFERHLMRCDLCADRVRELAGDTVRLGAAPGSDPGSGPGSAPPMVSPPMVPLPVEDTAAAQGGYAPGRYAPDGDAAPDAPDGAEPDPRRWWDVRRRTSAVRLAVAGAAAALLACAVLGALLLRASGQLERERGNVRAVYEVLTADDARPVYSSDDHGRGVTAVYSRELRRAVVTVQGLPPLEGRRAYQLWLVSERPTAFRSVGVLGAVPVAGDAPGPLVAAGLDERSFAFTVTVEPSGGSVRPTSDPVAQLPLLALGIGS
ncbi:anti-sigma factor [Streptomyces sp. NPDC026673]|uniref:anti-sigma factor n=1 Tax=Streptomyces sp. NPDC026673 TaxID=3155724 RepID=UPI00340855CD